jgi:hypothetical protein
MSRPCCTLRNHADRRKESYSQIISQCAVCSEPSSQDTIRPSPLVCRTSRGPRTVDDGRSGHISQQRDAHALGPSPSAEPGHRWVSFCTYLHDWLPSLSRYTAILGQTLRLFDAATLPTLLTDNMLQMDPADSPTSRFPEKMPIALGLAWLLTRTPTTVRSSCAALPLSRLDTEG